MKRAATRLQFDQSTLAFAQQRTTVARARQLDRHGARFTGVGAGAHASRRVGCGVRLVGGMPSGSTSASIEALGPAPSQGAVSSLAGRSIGTRGRSLVHPYFGHVDLGVLGSPGSAPHQDPLARHYRCRSDRLSSRAHDSTMEAIAFLTDSVSRRGSRARSRRTVFSH